MGAFTKPTEADVNEILSLYDFGRTKTFLPLGHGISNSNFKVVLEDRNILLKISDDKGEADLLSEIKLLEVLKKMGFPYSIFPLMRPNGQLIYHYNDRVGVIFEFIEGKIPQISGDVCKKIGSALGLLHSLKTDSYLRPYDEVGFGTARILDYLSLKTCPEDFKKIFSEVFPDHLNGFSRHRFEEGFIHGDLYFDNTLFDNGILKVILDFEQAGKGPFILDLGIAISGTCLENGKINRPLLDSFVSGYESHRKLPLEEKAFLKEAILVGLFSISLWRIKRFKEGNLDPSRRDCYQELLLRAKDFNYEISKI